MDLRVELAKRNFEIDNESPKKCILRPETMSTMQSAILAVAVFSVLLKAMSAD